MVTTHYNNDYENSITFDRSNGEHVNLCVGKHPEIVELVVFDNADDCDVRESITLSYAEARILRDLLNRPEVQAVLDKE